MFKSLKASCVNNLRALLHDCGGNVMPIMAAALIPTMTMVGGGVDFGRAYMAKSKLQGAVDAGALAAVRAKQITSNSDTAAKQTARSYMDANFPVGYMASTIEDPDITVTDVDDVITATLTANGDVETTLLKLIGINSLPIAVTATAEASDVLPAAVEALLVLDNTGSMQGNRMKQLKSASKNFMDIIYGNKNTRDNFAVGILPYNTMVNVGHLVRMHDSSMVLSRPGFTDVSASDPLGWKGCLFADETIQDISSDSLTMDSGAFDLGDNMPGEGGMSEFDPFIYPPIKVQSFQDVDNRYTVNTFDEFRKQFAIPTVRSAMVRLHGNGICSDTSYSYYRSCDLPNSVIHPYLLPDYGDYKAARFYSHKSGNSKNASPNNQWGPSPNYQCPAQALPVSYSTTKTQLKDYIDRENEALSPGTGTFHNPAMTWAYRLISRDDIFPRSRPTNIPTRRVVVFMTDGNFDSRDDGRNSSSGKVQDTAYTAYKTYEDRIVISNTDRDDTIEHMSRRFSKTCESMKSKGIEIYTIAFSLSNNSEGKKTREMFRACATDRNTHFFDTSSGSELNNAFVTIASELVDLRLSN